MSPHAPPLPSQTPSAPVRPEPKPLSAARPLEATEILERIYRGQTSQTHLLQQIRGRLTWVVVLLVIPYVLAAISLLFWMLFFGILAAGAVSAGAAAMEGARQQADEARRRAPTIEIPAGETFVPPIRRPVDEDGYVSPDLPENAEEILREFGRESRR